MKKGRTVLQAKRFGIITCNEHITLLEAARRMVDEDVSALVVVDDDGYLSGIITRTDLLRAYHEHDHWERQVVMNYMVREVVTVSPSDLLSQVAEIILEKQIHRVVVVNTDEGKFRPVGVLSIADLVYHMVKEE